MCVALLGGASSAWAGVGFSMVPTVPQNVAVGDTGVQSSLIITNASANGPGESGYEGDNMLITSISFVPSCGSTASGEDCPANALDPGVLVPSPLSGTGAAGTACAGRTFTFTLIDPGQGKYSVTIDGALALVLGPTSGSLAVRQCIINYTASVVKMPASDSEPGSPGVQTGQKAAVGGIDQGGGGTPSNNGKTGLGVGTAGTTIAKRTPVITTNASANVTLGAGSLSDQATISGLVQPVTTGGGVATVEFRLYGPNDATCTTAIFTSASRPLTFTGTPATGATAQSESFTPTAAGTYSWQAFYSGDANNQAVNGLCNAANETATVTPKAGAVLSEVCTTPPGPAPAGGELCQRGTAAISGRTGCQGTPFRVSVKGREIARVVYSIDGKKVRTLNKANRGSQWVLQVNPRRFRPGVHRVIARTTFSKRSGTNARTLRVAFSRCGRRASAPAFTG